MKSKYLLTLCILSVLFSCRKEKDHSAGTPGVPLSLVALKLKDIRIDGLPSPYYQDSTMNREPLILIMTEQT